MGITDLNIIEIGDDLEINPASNLEEIDTLFVLQNECLSELGLKQKVRKGVDLSVKIDVSGMFGDSNPVVTNQSHDTTISTSKPPSTPPSQIK